MMKLQRENIKSDGVEPRSPPRINIADTGESRHGWRTFVFPIVTALVAALAVASFLMLGATLREFLVFDADRTQSGRELERLRQLSGEQEKVNAAYGETLANRESLLTSSQQAVEEYITLTGRVLIAHNEILAAQEELKGTRETLSSEQGALSSAKKENAVLNEHRQLLDREIAVKSKELSGAEAAIGKLKEEIIALGQDKAASMGAADAAQKQCAVEVERLTNLTIQTEFVRKTQQEVERDVESAKASLAALMVKIQTAESQLTERIANAEGVDRTVAKAKDDLIALAKAKAEAQGAEEAIKIALADASILHTNLMVKVKSHRETLEQLEAEADKARTVRDTLAAQAAIAQEIVKSKTTEKIGLEADIIVLTGKKEQAAREVAKVIREEAQ
ncbi:MAG: hypothetical protein R6X19_06685 [Kiritimatiellia bacterium]